MPLADRKQEGQPDSLKWNAWNSLVEIFRSPLEIWFQEKIIKIQVKSTHDGDEQSACPLEKSGMRGGQIKNNYDTMKYEESR